MPISLPMLASNRGSGLPRSQAERLWLIGGGVIAFLMLLLGYFLFISPQRSQTADVQSQVGDARRHNAQLQTRIEALQAQNRNLPKYRAELAEAQLALPSTSGVSDFLRSLQALGNATLTNVASLTVGQPTDVSTVAAAAPAAAPAPAATTTVAPAKRPKAIPASQLETAQANGAASTGATVYGLAITAQVNGSPAALNKFLDQLQNVQPRAVLITMINEIDSVQSASGSGPGTTGMTLQLSMQAFVAPAGPGENAQLAQGAGR